MAKTILKHLMRQIQRRIDRDSSDEESSEEGTNAFKLWGESIPESVAEVESFGSREYAWMESAPESEEDHRVVIYWLPLDICVVRISLRGGVSSTTTSKLFRTFSYFEALQLWRWKSF